MYETEMLIDTIDKLRELIRVALNHPDDLVRVDAIRQLFDIAYGIDVDGEDQ